ncbi:hypothetical protein BFT35_04960 [Thermoanaerobacterium thermosaccharolyticum]|uniref:hypothetical protein n=1 Tax=Thermoanaerobacterium thermosaccharolyticum TaxID=1517 RepID=UPI000C08B976|nr:hypothetical protein [Thermoanaerobacterium thermosaccharolyticum]PHO07620.1 hypothetical protein BFT35_04960 [Thermoanaerobacterium thermosaccharolyticum]
MNWMGIVIVIAGVVYLIYSFLSKDKLTYYSRRIKMTLIKSNEFLKLQLKFSILNSIYLIIFGILIVVFNLNTVFIVVAAVLFHFINFLLILEAKKKGYVDYK